MDMYRYTTLYYIKPHKKEFLYADILDILYYKDASYYNLISLTII